MSTCWQSRREVSSDTTTNAYSLPTCQTASQIQTLMRMATFRYEMKSRSWIPRSLPRLETTSKSKRVRNITKRDSNAGMRSQSKELGSPHPSTSLMTTSLSFTVRTCPVRSEPPPPTRNLGAPKRCDRQATHSNECCAPIFSTAEDVTCSKFTKRS